MIAARGRGATDTFPGLGRVEQLVLRGDGLTTTSLEILSGCEIGVRVRRHWRVALPDDADDLGPGGGLAGAYTGLGAGDLHEWVGTAFETLGVEPGGQIIVREVLLTGDDGVDYGASSVVVALGRLPVAVAGELAATDVPIGKLLRRSGVAVRRELRWWGLAAAGSRAALLDARLGPADPLPARMYVMRLVSTGAPLAAFTEWFAPRLFEAGGRS